MKNHIPLYVINNFLKFERKLYQVFGLPLGRPIRLKSILYAIVIGVIEVMIYFTPVIGGLIRWIPILILIMIPIGLAWLLSDVGTEDRPPLSFFKSFLTYQVRKIKGQTYFRGRTVAKERNYTFDNYFTFANTQNGESSLEYAHEIENAIAEREKTLRYIERMKNPEGFFAEIKRKNTKPKKKKWFFIKGGIAR